MMRSALILTVASATIILAGCRPRLTRVPATAPAGDTRSDTTTFDNCNPRNQGATFVGRVNLTFTGASRGEAVVRIFGESYESTVRIDVATGTSLELREDSYIVRVSVPDFRAVEQTVKVVCGKDIRLPIALTRR